MKRSMILIVCVLVVLAAVVTVNCSKENAGKQEAAATSEVKLETLKQKNSYALGYNMGRNFDSIQAHVDLDVYIQGLRDGTKGKGKLTDEEMQQLIMNFQKDMMKRQQEEMKAMAEKNKAEGEKFLAENAKKEGIKVTESGLQYEIIKEGNGPQPTVKDRVSVTYKGTKIDGSVFDERTSPITFHLGNMIKGWKEGIPLMKVGSKYRFYVPSEQGYGPRGPRKIGPHAVLIFDVELFEINPKPPAPPAPPKGQPAQKPQEKK